MKIVFMGTPDFAAVALERLILAGHDITAVVTQPDRPKGRSHVPAPSPVKELAARHGIRVLQPEKIRDEESVRLLSMQEAELFVVAAFGQILPKSILDMPPYGCINVHASLLPLYRGAAPIQQAILDGRKETGVTIQMMTEKLDAGDIIGSVTVPIGDEETGGELFDKLADKGADLLVETVERIKAGNITPVPQDESKSTYVKMLKKEDGRLDFSLTAAVLHDRIRGLDPWPGAFTFFKGKKLKIFKSSVLEEAPVKGAASGTVISAGNDGIDVCCGGSVLRITELQAEGKKRMKAGDYLRGSELAKGDILG